MLSYEKTGFSSKEKKEEKNSNFFEMQLAMVFTKKLHVFYVWCAVKEI